jgi:UDP-glucuronate 4-epimerase
MRALVTGAAGFIGSTISQHLCDLGYVVTGIDALTDYYDQRIKQRNIERLKRNDGFNFIQRDLSDLRFDISGIVGEMDYVFHQAGQPGVRKSWGSEFGVYTRCNINATQRLLEASKDVSTLKRFVYASSSSVYGDAERYPVEEGDLPRPVSPYGVTKLAAEHLVSLYGHSFGVPTVSLRYFTVFGPAQRPDMAFTRFISAALRGEEIPVLGTGDQIRDFTYVDDVVRANLAVSDAAIPNGSVFNVAGGSSISVNQVLQFLEHIHGDKVRVRRDAAVPGDVFRTGGSSQRLYEATGWKPMTDVRTGLERQYSWLIDSELLKV